jgi:hypothetical protein
VRPPPAPQASRLWYLAGFALSFVVILVTCAPILENPQFEVDEYRYLHNLQALEADPEFGILDACMVENNWDHLWWVKPRSTVRYFRPIVVASFYLNGDPSGSLAAFAWMNIGLHIVCTWLVLLVVFRLLGPGLPGVLATMLFAGLACHSEALWYFTGRNASLAALGFLGALVCHMSGRRFLALVPFVFALSAKESTIVLPAVCLLYDRWCRPGGGSFRAVIRQGRNLWAAYLVITVAWLIVRRLLVGPMPDGDHYPYLIPPWHSEFGAHVLTQFLSYGQNLAGGLPSNPFMTLSGLMFHWSSLLLLVLIVGLEIVLLRGDRRFAFLLALGFLTWLPTSFVYVSERYLYMPSIAWVAAIGLVFVRAMKWRGGVWGVLAVGLFLVGQQSFFLWQKHDVLRHPRKTLAVTEKVLEALPTLPPNKDLLFVHFPSDWLHAQFLEAHLRVLYKRPNLRVYVLSPVTSTFADVTQEGEHTLVVRSGDPFVERKTFTIHPWVDLSTGSRFATPGMTVEVLSGTKETSDAVRYRFDRPLRDALLMQFHPPREAREWTDWIRSGRIRVSAFK